MKLYGTYPSHFTRKVRVVLQELGLPFEFSVVRQLMETGEEKFGQNPLHQIPVLEDEGRHLIESDLICEYLVERYGTRNPRLVLFPIGDIYEHKKRLALMNGAMSAGVKLIRARRSGIHWDYPFFQQEQAALTGSLRWLNEDLGTKTAYGAEFSLLDITLVSLAQWVVFREMVPDLKPYPAIERFVDAQISRPSLAQTHPAMEGA